MVRKSIEKINSYLAGETLAGFPEAYFKKRGTVSLLKKMVENHHSISPGNGLKFIAGIKNKVAGLDPKSSEYRRKSVLVRIMEGHYNALTPNKKEVQSKLNRTKIMTTGTPLEAGRMKRNYIPYKSGYVSSRASA